MEREETRGGSKCWWWSHNLIRHIDCMSEEVIDFELRWSGRMRFGSTLAGALVVPPPCLSPLGLSTRVYISSLPISMQASLGVLPGSSSHSIFSSPARMSIGALHLSIMSRFQEKSKPNPDDLPSLWSSMRSSLSDVSACLAFTKSEDELLDLVIACEADRWSGCLAAVSDEYSGFRMADFSASFSVFIPSYDCFLDVCFLRHGAMVLPPSNSSLQSSTLSSGTGEVSLERNSSSFESTSASYGFSLSLSRRLSHTILLGFEYGQASLNEIGVAALHFRYDDNLFGCKSLTKNHRTDGVVSAKSTGWIGCGSINLLGDLYSSLSFLWNPYGSLCCEDARDDSSRVCAFSIRGGMSPLSHRLYYSFGALLPISISLTPSDATDASHPKFSTSATSENVEQSPLISSPLISPSFSMKTLSAPHFIDMDQSDHDKVADGGTHALKILSSSSLWMLQMRYDSRSGFASALHSPVLWDCVGFSLLFSWPLLSLAYDPAFHSFTSLPDPNLQAARPRPFGLPYFGFRLHMNL